MNPLTYCSNIHAGESWDDVLHNLEAHAIAVKQQVSLQQPFPLGLRISNQASLDIGVQEINEFHQWCDENDCYLLTINGFPYGAFHQKPVKTSVYEPDWRTQERVDYTNRLGDIAADLMTRTTDLSISTVPIAFKQGFSESDWDLVRIHLISTLTHLQKIHTQTGIKIRLALEPEPLCVLETMQETIAFFSRMNFPAELRDYIGICFDCCHQAVEFEDPTDCLKKLRTANITIAKVQVSSALRAIGNEINNLLQFNEPIYLHQVVAQKNIGDDLEYFTDLPEFKQRLDSDIAFTECRAHFHVPIFLEHMGYCGTTRFFLEEFLPQLDASIPLEIETYSFQNLPEEYRKHSVSESIARELQWVQNLLNKQIIPTNELTHDLTNETNSCN